MMAVATVLLFLGSAAVLGGLVGLGRPWWGGRGRAALMVAGGFAAIVLSAVVVPEDVRQEHARASTEREAAEEKARAERELAEREAPAQQKRAQQGETLTCPRVAQVLAELTPLIQAFQKEADSKGIDADLSHHAEPFGDLANRIPDGQGALGRVGDLLWASIGRYETLAMMWSGLNEAGIENELRIARQDLEAAIAEATSACGSLDTSGGV